MAFSESFEYIRSLGLELGAGRKFDPALTAALLHELGEPQRRFVSIHIAGTNGKGSMAAMIDAALRAAGHRTGLYTSPHLQQISERIRVDGENIGEEAFSSAVDEVRRTSTRMVEQQRLPQGPSFFEAITAAGFLALARSGVEVGVIEAGLGGRLDATNVLQSKVAVIGPIGMDHEAYLGRTIPAIAGEKAGIIKPGVAVAVSAGQMAEAEAVIAAQCEKTGTRLVRAAERAAEQIERRGEGRYRFRTRYRDTSVTLEPGLRGRHQVQNAVTALLACEEISRQGFDISAEALAYGIAHTHWPGRLEKMQAEPEVWLDGAHNPAAASVLAAFLEELSEEKGAPVLIYGSMRDKAIGEITRILFAKASAVVLTPVSNPRAASPEEIMAAAATSTLCEIAEGITAALARATKLAAGRPVVICGSLYLAGEARERWHPTTPAMCGSRER